MVQRRTEYWPPRLSTRAAGEGRGSLPLGTGGTHLGVPGALLPPREIGGLPGQVAPPVTQAPGHPLAGKTAGRWDGTPLPPSCRLARGIFDAACLVDSLPLSAPLPADCRDRRVVSGHIRAVFRADCLRDAGYRTPR